MSGVAPDTVRGTIGVPAEVAGQLGVLGVPPGPARLPSLRQGHLPIVVLPLVRRILATWRQGQVEGGGLTVALWHRAIVPSLARVCGVAPDPGVTATGGVPAVVVVAQPSQAVLVGRGVGPLLAMVAFLCRLSFSSAL